MRHGKKINHLSRTAPHRKAMLSNMAGSLIIHKRISTTLAKAKALRKYVEPLITKAKNDTTHSRRVVFSYLQHKDPVKVLFNEVADRIGNRPGGYTRILKTGQRLGDNAEMCIIELVDYNDAMLQSESAGKTKTRRSRRRGKSKSTSDQTTSQSGADQSTKAAEKPVEKEQTAEQDTAQEEQIEAAAEEAATAQKEQSEAPETKEEASKEDDKDQEKKEGDQEK
ncbi:MAG: 50S ribosomal protein L17 [Candidatus Cyclobacteriaceae bacterium M3_2C_046]